jgi:hypothetical protein
MIEGFIATSAQRKRTSQVPPQLEAPLVWAKNSGVRAFVSVASGYSDITYARCVQFTEALKLASSNFYVLSVDEDVRFTEDAIRRLVECLLETPPEVGAVTVPCRLDPEAASCDVCCMVDGSEEAILCGLGAILFKAEALSRLAHELPYVTPHGQAPLKPFTASGVIRHSEGFDFVGEDYRLIARLHTLGCDVAVMFDDGVTHKGVKTDTSVELNAFGRAGYFKAIEDELTGLKVRN